MTTLVKVGALSSFGPEGIRLESYVLVKRCARRFRDRCSTHSQVPLGHIQGT